MNWRRLFTQNSAREVGRKQSPVAPADDSPAPDSQSDPYAEKRRRALEVLGERWTLHPSKRLRRRGGSGHSGAGRDSRSA